MSAPTPRLTVPCPVDGCEGWADTHTGDSVAEDLHTRPVAGLPRPAELEVFVESELTMDATSWPLWRANVELLPTPHALDHGELVLIAGALLATAFDVDRLNREVSR